MQKGIKMKNLYRQMHIIGVHNAKGGINKECGIVAITADSDSMCTKGCKYLVGHGCIPIFLCRSYGCIERLIK